MKTLFTFLIAISMAPLSAQIVNGDFESWITVNESLVLEGWESYTFEDINSVTQDLEAYEGIYAVRVEALENGAGSFGSASTIVDIDYIPPSLDFYVKASSEFGAVMVDVTFYNESDPFNSFDWTSADEVISEWTFVSIPLVQNEPVLTHAEIRITAQVGDFAPGSAVISVDQMEFGNTTGLNDLSEKALNIYPNPTSNAIRIAKVSEVSYVEIMDLSGKLVRRLSRAEIQNEISVRDLTPACYTVIAYLKTGEIARQKLVVSR